MAFASSSGWALGPQPMRALGAEFRNRQDPRGKDALHGRADDLAPRYALLADDSSAEAKKREAAMLFCTAEGHLGEDEIGEALRSAMEALPLFRELGDLSGVHDTLRVIVSAQRIEANMDREERPVEAERLARQELAAFEAAADRRGQAAMLLSLAECLCDHRGVRRAQIDEAEAWVQRSVSLFREVGDSKMAATALLELAHIHAMREEADGVLQNSSLAESLFKSIGDRAGCGRAVHGFGIGCVMERRLHDAVDRIKEALGIFRELGVKKQEAFELCVMAEVHLEDEQPARALPAAREALSLFREVSCSSGWEATALHAVVRSLISKQQPDLAVKAAQEGAERLSDRTDRRQEVYAYEILCDALLSDGQVAQALDACRHAHEVAREVDDKRLEIGVLHATMWVHIYAGDWNKAADQMDDAQGLAQDLGDDYDEAVAVHNITFLHLMKCEHRQVVERASEACGLFAKADSKKGEAGSLLLVASSFGDHDKPESAIDHCIKAQDLFRDARDLMGEYDACKMLSDFYMQREDVEAAVAIAERCVDLMRSFSNKRLESQALRVLSRVQISGDQHEAAEKSALRAKEVASAVQDRAEMTSAQLLLTDVLIAMREVGEGDDRTLEQQLQRALRSSAEAVALSGRCNDRGLVALARFARARLFLASQRPTEARRFAEEALKWFRKAEDALGEARALVLCSDAALDLGDKDEAVTLAEEARTVADATGSLQARTEVTELLQRIEKRNKVVVQAAIAAPVAEVGEAAQGTAGAAAEAAVSVATPEPQGLDPAVVRAKVMELTLDLMASDDGELFDDSPFMEAGMDSLSSVQLMSELGKAFQMAMSPSLVFDFPTINALADHLVEESQSAAAAY